ncbi:MAG: hypothetical protein K9L95_02360 [Candidatus Omnitrophica bacterium]|nr:hypothetical protein [Candidatus Omnitrophota bacterium]MCF7878299.1 hypothetical protein [Candidatus Omnitrophota bacterium]MCF7892764.1 hypothetical protein [Candidatus Omnitrophota bacterium]
MKKMVLAFIVGLAFFSSNLNAQSENNKYLKNTLDLIADKTLEAYNSQDYIGFFKYYTNSLSQLKTKKYFDNLFVSVYKNSFGDIVSKELVDGKSSFNSDYPRLVYKAKCAKHNNVLIQINFQEESGNYRINRITFDRKPQGENY